MAKEKVRMVPAIKLAITRRQGQILRSKVRKGDAPSVGRGFSEGDAGLLKAAQVVAERTM